MGGGDAVNRVDIFDQSGALTGWFHSETAQLMIRVAPADGQDE
jgi:hypothetical protein